MIMKCPYCGSEKLKVVDSRSTDDSIRRRRICEDCGNRFTTHETIENTPLMVIKKDNARELFRREKLISGMTRSTYKRPVTMEQLEKIAFEIEQAGQSNLSKEMSSREIGEMVMDKLKDLDEVSYVRFASVYREFKDVNSFMEELRELIAPENKEGKKK